MTPEARIISMLMIAFNKEPGRLTGATNNKVLSTSYCSQLEWMMKPEPWQRRMERRKQRKKVGMEPLNL